MRTLADCTVLVVEYNGLIAWDIEEMLREAGCERIHLAQSIYHAKIAMHQHLPTVAVLDVDLGYGRSFAIADMLATMRIPFLFLTAQNANALPPEHGSRPVIVKPQSAADLIEKILELVNPREPVDAFAKGMAASGSAPAADAESLATVAPDQSEE